MLVDVTVEENGRDIERFHVRAGGNSPAPHRLLPHHSLGLLLIV